MTSSRRATWAEVDARLASMDTLITRLRDAVDGHERWHRDQEAVSRFQRITARIAVMTLTVSAVSAVAAVTGIIVMAMKG